MHAHDVTQWQHKHEFDQGNPAGEIKSRRVIVLSAAMMLIEITAGILFGSLALLADGWHMSTHVAALGITVVAYRLARVYAQDARFAFGTWKIEVLGGFASAVVLVVVGILIGAESIERLIAPITVHYDQALLVALLGLAVNLLSAFWLHDHEHSPASHDCSEHDQKHDGKRPNHHHGHGSDLNLRAAYIHVVTDAITSVCAILALLGGKFLGWGWLDPVMGFAGAAIVLIWALGLMRATGSILLDREMDHAIVSRIRGLVEADGSSHIYDLHVWRVGRRQFACIVSVVTCVPKSPSEYRARLQSQSDIVHVTVEVTPCPEHSDAETGLKSSS